MTGTIRLLGYENPNDKCFSKKFDKACFSILFDKPDDKLMRMAKIAIALHCSGSLVEYAIVSIFSYFKCGERKQIHNIFVNLVPTVHEYVG